jgi:hypothetical protein
LHQHAGSQTPASHPKDSNVAAEGEMPRVFHPIIKDGNRS